ncbi:MAG: hypothetical protein CMJ62_12725 [Planctomycetaceae bacterium]|nr:hypothetical protein [Planctomycetaceae bacterium]
MLHQLIKSGRSFSGRERNCVFLNLGQSKFANISHCSGLDFPDDGRGVSTVDWDQDGDLDLWINNRNGPQIRFCRNDVPSRNHYLAVRLEGRTCNRDAIGARVEVKVLDSRLATSNSSEPGTENREPSTVLIKTVRAGDAYLSQSSKWVHFGLGAAEEIEQLVVRWPGGEREKFLGVEVDGRYRVVQGEGEAKRIKRSHRPVHLEPSVLTGSPVRDQARIPLAGTVPMPQLFYDNFAGRPEEAVLGDGKPVLVNLWASWCMPCLRELQEMSLQAGQLRDLDVNVLALSVDGQGDDRSDKAAAEAALKRLKFPFTSGMATVATINKLQGVHDALFDRRRPLPVPVSFLIDGEGHLAVIYRGELDIEQLLRDVEQLESASLSRRNFSSLFSGRWHRPLRDDAFLAVVREVVSAGYDQYGLKYLDRYALLAEEDPKYPQLLVDFGNVLASKNRFNEALTQYMKALELKPEMANAYHNIGVVHNKLRRLSKAIENYERAVELDPELAKAHKQLAIIMLRRGRFDEASKHFEETVRLRPESATDYYNLAQSRTQQKEYSSAIKSYRRAIEIDPTLAKAHYQLGVLLDSQNENETAMNHLRQAIKLKPSLVDAHKALGIALHRLGRSAEAIEPLSRVVRSKSRDPIAHFNLALACEAAGRDQEAVVKYRRVLELDPDFASAQNKLAWVLATSTDPSIRDGAQAVSWAEKACDATHYRAPEPLDSLAAAYAQAGQFDKAVATAEKAIRLSEDRGSSELAEQIKQRLELYRQGKPYRAD